MKTEFSPEQLKFHGLQKRDVIRQFNGGKITSDACGLLLREVEKCTHILKRLSQCFTDYRSQDIINTP